MTKRQVKPLNLSGVDPYDPSGRGAQLPVAQSSVAASVDEPAVEPAPPAVQNPPSDEPAGLSLSDFDFDPPPLRARPVVDPRERKRSFKAAEPKPEAKVKQAPKPPAAALGAARYAYIIAALGGVVWAGCFIAFVLGFQNHVAPLTYMPFQAVILAMLTVLPAAFMLLAAFAVRQAAALAADTRAARQLAEDMSAPALLAAANAGGVMETLRGEIERSAAAARSAHDEMAGLSRTLTAETDRLTQAAGDAQRTARIIGETLGRERDEVAALVADLHTGVQEISMGVETQTRLVADASDLARSQLQEAEAGLAARAADLSAAGASTSALVREAGDQLNQNASHLDAAGAALAERLRHLDLALSEQRKDIADLMQACERDQAALTAQVESRRVLLIEAVTQARLGAAEIDDASGQSADMLSQLVTASAERLRELVQTAHAGQTALADEAAHVQAEMEAGVARAVVALGEAAQDAYAATAGHADHARQAAQDHIGVAKDQIEQLGELAFAAGQRANQAFDARINDARKLIERSAELVEEAGARSAGRIDAGLDAARASLSELTRTLADIDARMDRLPEDARARAQAMRQAVDQGVGDLAAAARRVADETQAIDAAFQERVKRNYETLSDAVRLMGRVATAAEAPPPAAPDSLDLKIPAVPPAKPTPPPAAPAAIAPSPAPRRPTQDFIPPEIIYERDSDLTPPRLRPGARDPAPLNGRLKPPGAQPVFGRANQRDSNDDFLFVQAPFAGSTPEPEGRTPAPSKAADSAPRPRLRLTPTEADDALKTVFDPLHARGREAEAARTPRADDTRWENDLDEWTWRDLLSSIEEVPAGEDELAEQMVGEISALGIDLDAVLPRVRLEQIAESLRTDDPSAVRDSVRRLAPAAIRRLSRRVLTDKTLREQADRYVRRYDSLLRGAGETDSRSASTLLSSDPGRAYLLLDAAVGDLQ
ncbi:MAG: coiled-coil domain-containing protein [Caulobacteraceae bacterium]